MREGWPEAIGQQLGLGLRCCMLPCASRTADGIDRQSGVEQPREADGQEDWPTKRRVRIRCCGMWCMD